jgi:hypothetical protein
VESFSTLKRSEKNTMSSLYTGAIHELPCANRLIFTPPKALMNQSSTHMPPQQSHTLHSGQFQFQTPFHTFARENVIDCEAFDL